MNTSSIMRGDWLFYKGRFNAFPFKVEQITKKKIGYHVLPNENRIYYLRPNEVFPIPLTEEILERNGFKYNKDETEGTMQQVYKHYTKFFDFPLGRGFYIEHDTIDNIFWITDHIWVKFQYVHELQQVIKKCGINKEIIL